MDLIHRTAKKPARAYANYIVILLFCRTGVSLNCQSLSIQNSEWYLFYYEIVIAYLLPSPKTQGSLLMCVRVPFPYVLLSCSESHVATVNKTALHSLVYPRAPPHGYD